MGATTTLSASPADALQMPPTRGQASDVTCLVLTREPSALLQEAVRWRQAPVQFVASWTTLARGAGPPGRSGQKEGQTKGPLQPTRELTNHNRGRTASPASAGRRPPRAVDHQRPGARP